MVTNGEMVTFKLRDGADDVICGGRKGTRQTSPRESLAFSKEKNQRLSLGRQS